MKNFSSSLKPWISPELSILDISRDTEQLDPPDPEQQAS
jgi:hypothetical protein